MVAVSEYVREYLISEGVAADQGQHHLTGIRPDALALDGPSSLRGELAWGRMCRWWVRWRFCAQKKAIT